MGRALREESMPPWKYRILHPGVVLTQRDLIALERWIEAEIANQPGEETKNTEDSK
jgi:hypothetical protein